MHKRFDVSFSKSFDSYRFFCSQAFRDVMRVFPVCSNPSFIPFFTYFLCTLNANKKDAFASFVYTFKENTSNSELLLSASSDTSSLTLVSSSSSTISTILTSSIPLR